jgi:hypothetical protein
VAEAWFDATTFAILYGAIGGGVGGSLCGVLGALAGTLAPRGIGRTWILGAMALFLLWGAASAGAGVVALLAGQPYAIWFPFLLLGFIFTGVVGPLFPVVRQRYAEAEQRRIEAESIRTM